MRELGTFFIQITAGQWAWNGIEGVWFVLCLHHYVGSLTELPCLVSRLLLSAQHNDFQCRTRHFAADCSEADWTVDVLSLFPPGEGATGIDDLEQLTAVWTRIRTHQSLLHFSISAALVSQQRSRS